MVYFLKQNIFQEKKNHPNKDNEKNEMICNAMLQKAEKKVSDIKIQMDINRRKREQKLQKIKKEKSPYKFTYRVSNNGITTVYDVPSVSSSVTPTYGGSNKAPDTEYVQGILNGSGPGTINGYGIQIDGESL